MNQRLHKVESSTLSISQDITTMMAFWKIPHIDKRKLDDPSSSNVGHAHPPTLTVQGLGDTLFSMIDECPANSNVVTHVVNTSRFSVNPSSPVYTSTHPSSHHLSLHYNSFSPESNNLFLPTYSNSFSLTPTRSQNTQKFRVTDRAKTQRNTQYICPLLHRYSLLGGGLLSLKQMIWLPQLPLLCQKTSRG
jgi:hypothetical protein